MILRGTSISPGVARGKVYLLDSRSPLNAALAIAGRLSPTDEIERLRAARSRAIVQLEAVQRQLAAHGHAPDSAIFATHKSLLSDPSLTRRIEARILGEQISAEAAVAHVFLELEGQFVSSSSSLLQDKAADVLDIGQRLVHCLRGLPEAESVQNCILVATSLTPSALVRAAHQGAIAAVTELCGKKSHTAILARGFGLPLVSGIANVSELIPDGTEIAVDGDAGIVAIESQGEQATTLDEVIPRVPSTDQESPLTGKAVTTDGVRITLLLNISDRSEAEAVAQFDADGVGLYRTEFFYLDLADWPNETESYEQYEAVATAIGGRELNIRLADFGAEKCPPYADIPINRNPSLGIRGVRLLLSRDDILRPQVKAIERLARGREVTVLLPMIDTLETLNEVTARLCRHCGDCSREALPFRLGLMAEVPAAAFVIGDLIDHVDAVSVGLNDLTQYFLAADRDDELVELYHDPLQPAVLRLVKTLIDTADAANKPITMCGELAGEPLLGRALLGLGARRFSVSRSHFHQTSSLFRRLCAGTETQLAQQLLNADTGREVRRLLNESS